jgi:hypothetical protein
MTLEKALDLAQHLHLKLMFTFQIYTSFAPYIEYLLHHLILCGNAVAIALATIAFGLYIACHPCCRLGWEICLEFHGIPRLIRYRTFELRNFHWNFIFPIIKCVPAISEHVFSGSESSPAINSSNFMNQKTFPPWQNFVPNLHLLTLIAHFPLSVSICRFVFC